jgi:asparagine synthase (glutamine-hydrolysing)
VSRIAGIVGFGGDAPDPSELGAAIEGVFREDAALLVRAPRNGDSLEQPVVSDRYALVVDGRIWEGWRTLLDRWAAVGVGALAEIVGPFALAVWDRNERVLWLARGAMGTRALFWARAAQRVAFASEMAPLLRLGWISKEIATGHLAEYLSFRYVHSPRTLLRDVYSVPPGHVLRVDSDGERIERWWNPPWAPAHAPLGEDEETAARVDAVLHRAVERRLQGRVGVLLSGGLDSSAILHHARTLGAPPPTFTVTFEGDDSAESPYAGRIAKLMGAEHHAIRLEPEALVDSIEACTAAMGVPLPGPAALVQYLFFLRTRGEVAVALSGEGGDEVLGGRGLGPIAAGLRGTEAVRSLPGPIRGLARGVAGRIGLSNLAVTGSIGLERVIGGSDVFPEKERIALLQNPAHVRPGIRRDVLEPLYAEVTSDAINEILYVRQVGWLSEDTLARSERMAARAGLEIRYPMLDREMLEVAASIPGSMKVRRKGFGFTTKWPLRLAMEGRIPEQLLNRPKRTLPSPLDGWLRGAGAAFLVERTDALCADGLFHPEGVRRLVSEHRSGFRDHATRLWTLLFFQAWRSSL